MDTLDSIAAVESFVGKLFPVASPVDSSSVVAAVAAEFCNV